MPMHNLKNLASVNVWKKLQNILLKMVFNIYAHIFYNKNYNFSYFIIMFTDDIDLELRLARFEHLMERRLLLLNSALLRQNPHNVQEWHKRVRLYEGQPHEV